MSRRIQIAVAALLAAVGLVWWWMPERPEPVGARDQMTWARDATPAAAPPEAAGISPSPAPPAVLAAESAGPIAGFRAWSREFLAATPADRLALVAEGARWAEARRPVFKALIQDDPRRALEEAVPMGVRQQLPPDIVARLEERVNRRAELRVWQGVPAPGEAPPATTLTHRIAAFADGKAYAANVFGRRAQDTIGTRNDALNGVALDNQFAVSEEPARAMEPGERPDPAKSIVTSCPVSGKAVVAANQALEPIPGAAIAIETPEQVVYLCGGYHKDTFYQDYFYAEGGTGGPVPITGILPAAPTPALGVVKILFYPVTFADQNEIPTTESKCYEIMRDVADYYAKSSYGRLTTLTTVTPPIKLPHTEAWYVQKDTSNGGTVDGLTLERDHAREEARKLGYDWNDYHATVLRLKGGPRAVGGWGGAGSVIIYGDSVGVTAHEIGHSFGLAHANFWDTSGTSAIGAGTNAEYGDIFDVMGGGGVPVDQYNAQAKNQIKWLTDDYVADITQSGLYRVFAFDQTLLNPAQRYAIRILKDTQRTYWGEVRQLYNGNATRPWADKGLILGWRFPNGGATNVQLIDTTPGSPFAKDDSPISLGRTFSDFESGIHITTVEVSATTPKWVDVVVYLGQFPGNRAPTLALAASAETVPTGAAVTFTATASDADGDALAYAWQHFGDTSNAGRIVSPNAPSITRTFATAGSYVVACTVSDMKGGTVTRSKLITVGNGNSRFTISGRVTSGGVGLADVILTANAANAVVTDSDGYYTIPNLTANTYTMTALLSGYTFSEVFDNSVTVGPNFTGANFDADQTPRVSIAATIPAASETGPTNGRFTFTRTGDISQPLVVNVNTALGTATKTSDYTFSPDYVAGSQGFSNFTIPADSASLDVTVAVVNDAVAEGPETVILQLGPGNGYLVTSASAATVAIADNDTALPKVSVAATNPETVENSGSPATITFTRTGATTSALAVNYAVSGTASSGSDFTPLAGSVSIPIGAASAVVNISPVNDAVSESVETVTLTTSSNAAYIIDPVATSATVSIVDDDVQVLNVVATDPTAAEVDLSLPGAQADTGTFLITRTGDTSAPLTVYYSLSGLTTAGSTPATHGVDYDALSGVLVIPAGSASATVTITPRWDTLGEGTENVTLTLGAGPTNYQLGPNNSANVTIADAGGVPYVEVIEMANAAEPSTNGVFRISVKGAGAGTLTVRYTVSGTAIAGTDYTIAGLDNVTLAGKAALTLNNGTVTQDLSVVPINDALLEDLETITLTVTPNATYQTFAPTSAATMWLRDDDQPTVYVDPHVTNYPPSISESGAAGAFYLSRTGSTAAALTVNYAMSGTATNGTDYNALSGTATIPAGAFGVDVTVTPINDTIFEGTETIVMSLAPGAYSRGPAATLLITDNETSAQQVAFTGTSGSGLESVSPVSIPVALTSAATAPVTVEYIVTSGSRSSSTTTATQAVPCWVRLQRVGNVFSAFRSANGTTWTQTGANQTMALAPGSLAGLAVSARSDGALTTATFDNVTITPGPAPALLGRTVGFVNAQGSDSVAAGVYTVAGSGAAIGGTEDECHFVAASMNGDFTLSARVVSISGGAANAQAGVMVRETASYRARSLYMGAVASGTVEFITRATTVTTALGVGVDYAIGSGTLTFNIGDTAQNIPLTIVNDTIPEPNETLTILLRNPNGAVLGAPSSFIYTILDDDSPSALPTVGFAAAASSAPENSGVAQVLVALGVPAPGPVSVDFAITAGTAADGADFTAGTGTVNFAAGETVKAIPVPLLDDALVETAETVNVTLSNPVGATLGSLAQHTLTILDDEFPVVNIAATDANATEAGDTGTFTITRTGSTAGALTVNFTRSGTATSGSDFTAIASPGSVVIPDGAASTTVTVAPLQDTLNEGNETVILTLTATPASYTPGTSASATVTIADDDRSTVTIVANDPDASETPGNPGQFTLTRTAPTTSTLTVNYTITGTATNGTDYTSIGTSTTIAAGQTSRTINITPVDDALTEGPETVVLQIAAGTYDIGAASFATVTIADNDSPPTLFISNPAAQSPLIASGNGLIVSATVTDDGAPLPVVLAWDLASGPGTATFDNPSAATTGVTFSADGAYVLRVSANDGQFTVTDTATVIVGAAIAPASWIQEDLTPSSLRRGQSFEKSGVFTLTGNGAGYAATTDAAHLLARSVSGDSSIVARLSTLSGASSSLAGVTIRDSLFRGARRSVLGYSPGAGLQFRTRTTASAADTVTTQAGIPLPVWLRLVRNGTTNEITASYAADVAGAPGAWTALGAPTAIAMDAISNPGLTVTSGTTASSSTAVFDNVTLTPAGSGLLTEDFGATSPAAGTYAESAGTVTIGGSGSIDGTGFFAGSQYSGDLMVTAKLADATSSAVSAKSGIMIRESMDSGGYVFLGRIPQGAFNGYLWRTLASGATGGVPSFTGKIRWMRLIRQGNSVTAFHAADLSGAPGAWVQLGQPRTVVMTTPVLVGFAVDNAGGVGLNTAIFSNLSVVPLNKAPLVDAGSAPSGVLGPVSLDGTVSDDNFPAPPSLLSLWSKRSGPGVVNFGNPVLVDTTATLSTGGAYTLRLQVSDGSAETFDEVSFIGATTPFEAWQASHWAAGASDPSAAAASNPDFDASTNLLEYAFGTDPRAAGGTSGTSDVVTVGAEKYLRLTVPKNPNATDVSLTVEATSTLANPASWSSAGLVIEANTATLLRVRDNVPMSAGGPRFLRATVVQP